MAEEQKEYKEFRVAAISNNTNEFGLRGVFMIARDGEAWQVGSNDLNLPRHYQQLRVEVKGGEPDWSALGFEIPQRWPENAPPEVLRVVWGG